MPVRIRLTRMGKKKQPTYRVVVVDSRKSRDSAYLEQIGRYDPRQEPSLIEIDNDKAVDWLRKGAQPSDRAKKLLVVSGAWTQFRVSRGDIHTIESPARQQDQTAVNSEHEPEIHVVGASGPEAGASEVGASEPGASEPGASEAGSFEAGDGAGIVVGGEDVAAPTEATAAPEPGADEPADSTDEASAEDATGDEQT